MMTSKVALALIALLLGIAFAQAASEEFVDPYRRDLGETSLASGRQGEVYRAIVIPPVMRAYSVRIDVTANGAAHLTVKQQRTLREFYGAEVVGTRPLSPSELSTLRGFFERTDFWNLPVQIDNTAEWKKRRREEKVAPAPAGSGRDYTSNEPLTVVCADATVTVLEAAIPARSHAVYRDCGSTHIHELDRLFDDLGRPYVKAP